MHVQAKGGAWGGKAHTCRQQHRIESCASIHGKHICILAALQGWTGLFEGPAGSSNLHAWAVRAQDAATGVQKCYHQLRECP